MKESIKIGRGDAMKKLVILLFGVLVISTLCIGGCMQSQPVPPTPTATTVQTMNTPVVQADTFALSVTSFGNVLTDAKGMTLYFFATDIPGSGQSTCSGQCAAIWPITYSDTIRVSSPLAAADFSTFPRADGTKQNSYKGWPLYYYQSDTKPGDIRGEGVNKVWFVAKPDYTLMIASQPATGSYLTDGIGKTLYFFTKDTRVTSTCTDACLAKWPAFNADYLIIPSILKTSDFNSISRPDGVKQLTYMGRPLYYFADDKKPGDMLGQAFNNVWFVANVTGSVPVIATPVPTATTVPRTITPLSDGDSGGGGGGY